jgi:hypothetical protein
MIKPVVHYEGKAQFYPWEWDNDVTVGYLPKVVDHPKLGNIGNVRTSAVITPIDSEGRFETLNTIYEPYQNS